MKATILLLLLGTIFSCVRAAETRDQKVQADRKEVSESGFWIYNDLEQGVAQARATGKPMLVVFRCIP
jgi:serine protease Do